MKFYCNYTYFWTERGSIRALIKESMEKDVAKTIFTYNDLPKLLKVLPKF
jgi:hypothetical protein